MPVLELNFERLKSYINFSPVASFDKPSRILQLARPHSLSRQIVAATMSRVTDATPINPFERSDAPSGAPSAQARPTSEPVPVIGQPVYVFNPEQDAQPTQPWYARSTKMFTIMEIDVHVSGLMLLYIAIVVVLASFSGFYWFFLQLISSITLFATVLVHELGHCAAARKVGGTVSHILLWPLGGLAYINLDDSSAKGDLGVAVAGPATHIPMFFAWFLIYLATGGNPNITSRLGHNFVRDVASQGCWLNIYLFLFNLFIPAYPLDGSRVVSNMLAICGVSMRTAGWIVITLSVIMSCGLLAYGFILTQFLTLFVGVFTLAETWKLFSLQRNNQLAEHPTFAKYSDRSDNRASSNSWTVQVV